MNLKIAIVTGVIGHRRSDGRAAGQRLAPAALVEAGIRKDLRLDSQPAPAIAAILEKQPSLEIET